jgi:hypothetical protein
MRFVSSLVRTLMTAGSLLLLWLVSVLPASAAPSERLAVGGPVCELQTTTLRKLTRLHRSFGGPLKQTPPRQLLFGLTDPTARIRRGTRTAFHGQQAAIQNDAPAAHIDVHDAALPSLRPLELLVRAVDARPRSPAYSPRKPRGPPPAA